MTTALRGILPPMTTPFDENGELDLARVDDQVAFPRSARAARPGSRARPNAAGVGQPAARDRRGAREPDAWLGAVTF